MSAPAYSGQDSEGQKGPSEADDIFLFRD